MPRRMRKFGWAALCAAVLLGLYYAIDRWTGPDPVRIEVVIKSTDNSMDFWKVIHDGVRVAADEFGVEAKVTGSLNEADVEQQIAAVDAAIARKPDAIVLAATDRDRLVPVAERAAKRGIRLIILDSGIASERAISTVSTDNIKAGREAGAVMLEQLKGTAGPSKVAVINYMSSAASLIAREQGVREVLQGDGITILGPYDAEGLQDNAYEIAKRVIREHPDLTGIVGLNEPTSVGAGRAILDLGKEGDIRLIGFDSSMNEIKLLERGVMQATIIQKPFQMGYLSVKAAVDVIRGGPGSVPKFIDTGSLVITKQNMYEEENQKLLFPFYE